MDFPEPTRPLASRAAVLLDYLDYFRETAIARLEGMDDAAARASALPSRWTPVELLTHLAHVERRWLVWGFEGQPVDDPWADQRDGRWHVDANTPTYAVVERLRHQGLQTSAVVRRHRLDERGRPGERWDGAEPATLERVLLHLLQEYARHVGHLDVVREMYDGAVGE